MSLYTALTILLFRLNVLGFFRRLGPSQTDGSFASTMREKCQLSPLAQLSRAQSLS